MDGRSSSLPRPQGCRDGDRRPPGRRRERIAAAAARAGRRADAIRIVAAAKTQPPGAVAEALAAGVDAIGENRVQEAVAARPAVGGSAPWHLIGPLQRNKARHALEVFDVIETVDRAELADRLETLLAGSSRVVPVFLEINVGGEAQKSGFRRPTPPPSPGTWPPAARISASSG